MLEDLLYVTLRSETIVRFLGETLAYEVFAVVGHGYSVLLLVREEDWLALDEIVHFLIIGVASVEGRETDDHLVGQDAESPPVYRERMAFLLQDFWCQVFGSTAERVGLLILFEDLS